MYKIQKMQELIKKDLSFDQQKVVNAKGKNVVIAGPGSGKTKTIAYRLAKLLLETQESDCGVIALSFTNTAVQEIREKLDALGICFPLSQPHFLGTFDSFLTQKIFIRYANRVMRCSDIPQIVSQSQYKILDEFLPKENRFISLGRNTAPKALQLGKINYLPNGKLDFTDVLDGIPFWAKKNYDFLELYKAKAAYAKAGLATHSDVIFWCAKILEEDEWLLRYFQKTYKHWIVDEAQDTSSLHENLLRLLWASESDILVVGDPDQAIFEWNQASPDFLLNLSKDIDWQAWEITENWRSSQNICNASNCFRSPIVFSKPSLAVGSFKDLQTEPYLLLYNEDEVDKLPSKFEEIWYSSLGQSIPKKDVAIVSWTHKLLDQIRKNLDIRDYTTNLGSNLIDAIVEYTDSRDKGYKTFEILMCQLLLGRPSATERDLKKIGFEFDEWNHWLSVLLYTINLDYKNLAIDSFLQQARKVLENEIKKKGFDIKLSTKIRFKTKPDVLYSLDEIREQRKSENNQIPIKTIHKVKGMTLSGIMLVGTKEEVEQWVLGVDLQTNISKEQRRMAYVAMTRPQQLLVVALPVGTDEAILKHPAWKQGGFRKV